MFKKLEELINLCKKPTIELLGEALLCRQEFSEAESNFIRHLRKSPKSYYHYLYNCDRVIAKVATLYTRIGV